MLKRAAAISIALSLACAFPAEIFGTESAGADESDQSVVYEESYSEESYNTEDQTPSVEDPFYTEEEPQDFTTESEEENTDLTAEEETKASIEHESKVIWAKHKLKMTNPKNVQIKRWATTNKNVASVSKDGTVTANRLGTAVVQGFDESGNLRKEVNITVKLGRDYTLFVAHRGLSLVAPENTLPAFKAAVRANFGGIELDIWESRTTSKKSAPLLLVIHDSNIKAKTGKKKKTYKLNWSTRTK